MKTRYQVLVAGEWLNCSKASPTGTGWLHYQFRDGTIGLARPGRWRVRP